MELAKYHRLDHLCGLHLNLTEGTPSSLPSEIPSLLNSDARFRGKQGFNEACRRGEIIISEVIIEARAQIAWFCLNMGRAPAHIDGHQHCHVQPSLVTGLATVFRDYSVRTISYVFEMKRIKSFLTMSLVK